MNIFLTGIKNLRVFLIDRRDIKDGTIKMYQVEDVTTPKF